MKTRNEYTLFESLYPAEAWEKEVGQILKWVEKGQSGQLLGLPGVGKYLVLGLLAYNKKVRLAHLGEKQKSYQFVYIDFSEIRQRPLSDVMKMLFLALADSLRDRGMQEEYEKVNSLLRGAIETRDELVLTEELKHAIEFLVYERKKKVIYLLDQFEDYIPSVSSTFFANLRLLRNRAKYSFSVIFSLNKPLEDLLEPAVIDDYQDLMVGNALYLPLVDMPSVDFRLKHLEEIAGKKLPVQIIDEMLSLTGGHGKLMRLGSEAILANGEREGGLSEFLLKQETVEKALLEIWLSLSPNEQEYLLHFRTADPKVKEYLQNVHLLEGGRLEIPLLAEFIKQKAFDGEIAEQKIIYDNASNSIMKGQLVLSDDLTHAEFLFLRYLVLNPEKIISRDELIQAVWGDNPSTVGVTDQALDQLLFRVRRKIEADPASPVHILTVKGRGLKFTP